jgi:hypothetical protein
VSLCCAPLHPATLNNCWCKTTGAAIKLPLKASKAKPILQNLENLELVLLLFYNIHNYEFKFNNQFNTFIASIALYKPSL